MFKRILKYVKNPKMIILYLANYHFFDWMNDKSYLEMLYFIKMKKRLNLNNPQTFNEKLQWLKLNDRKEIYTKMVDKYEAKKYVAEKIGEEYIIPTIGVYNNFKEIDFDKLPKQFVIKCTHDSGGVVIVKDKEKMNIEKTRKKINKCLKQNFYKVGREWPYKNIKPRIIIEKYMEDKNDKNIKDYKFFCFNGKPELMYISEGMENHKTASMSFFDMNFNLSSCKRKDYKLLDGKTKKPKNFNKMKELSKVLSKGIPHLRVDFYEINGKIYFGELTFTTCSGFVPFEDESWDYKLGEFIKIK